MTFDLTGRRCLAIRRFHHEWRGESETRFGPVELTWDDGTVTTFEDNSDWSLRISCRPWTDPFIGASRRRRKQLAKEVGLWLPGVLPEALRRVIGQTVLSSSAELSGMNELVGLVVVFDDTTVGLRSVGGNLEVEIR